jgi:hypothetical protein
MAKRAKYRANRTNGYASRLESRVADSLRAGLAPGESLVEQVPILFACGAKYICDFAIMRDGAIVRYIEAKGVETPVWRLKLRLLRHEHPQIADVLTIVTAKGSRPCQKAEKKKSTKAYARSAGKTRTRGK